MATRFALGDDEPPIKWHEPWEYTKWREHVLKDESADEELLLRLYAEQWEPVECYKAMLHGRWFSKPDPVKKERRVALDLATVEKRIAKAIWVECSRLLVRRMTPEARAFVCSTQERAETAANIEIVGRGYD